MSFNYGSFAVGKRHSSWTPSQFGGDGEPRSLLSAAMARKGRPSLSSAKRAPDTSLEDLRKRIDSYQSKGWLSQQESKALVFRLEKAKGNPGSCDVVSELNAEMNALEGQMTQPATKTKEENPSPTGSSSDSTGTLIKTNTSSNFTSKSIVDPKFLQATFDEEELGNMFVQTCFYARLGFIQPPCCLQCTYRESMKGATPNRQCGRWLIWRVDAKEVLEPSNLADNIIAVRCHAARKLLSGNLFESHKWDKNSKVLLRPRSRGSFKPKSGAYQ